MFPIHPHFLFFISVSIGTCLVLSHKRSFETTLWPPNVKDIPEASVGKFGAYGCWSWLPAMSRSHRVELTSRLC